VVNRSAADALAELDMSPADISLVINTHPHFDHCGQNAVFRHAPVYVQRAELDRMRRESADLYGWLDFMNARFELLIGDAAYTPRQYAEPSSDKLPSGQASDVRAWRDSVRRIHPLRPERVHFCHHTEIVHS